MPETTQTVPTPSAVPEADTVFVTRAEAEESWKTDPFDWVSGKIRDTRPSAYLAGPMTGKPIDELWRDYISEYLVSHSIQPINPFDLHHNTPDLKFVFQDLKAVEDCDAVLCVIPYTPDRQSIGTFMELSYAVSLHKKIMVFGPIDIIDHPFIRALIKKRRYLALTGTSELSEDDKGDLSYSVGEKFVQYIGATN